MTTYSFLEDFKNNRLVTIYNTHESLFALIKQHKRRDVIKLADAVSYEHKPLRGNFL